MKKNDNNLFYTCSLIELIGRTTRQKRKDTVTLMGEKIISHIYHHADTLHCEPIAGIADYYIDFCHIPTGNFDNVASCRYLVPSYWDIGKVYARLIEDIRKDDVIAALFQVYNSAVSDSISYYNSDFFYQPRGFIKEQFLSEENAEAGKASKKPAIRFRDFTDAWEQRKLSDFVQREATFRISSAEYPCVEYEDVVAEEGRLNKDIRQKETQKTGVEFDGTQVLYGKLRPYLHNWLNPNFQGVAVGDWWVLRPIGVDKNFLFRLIQTKHFDEVANQSSGSKMPRADWKLVSNTEFIIPVSVDEQRQIAETFDHLDHLLTLHQRKYDKLTKIKKSMLEKLFPKNDNKFPEIRFKGFTDAWEQRKVGEIADRYDNLRIPVAANLRKAGSTPYYGANGIQDYVEGYTHDGEFVLVAEDGANDLKNYPVKCVKGRIWVNNHAHVLQGKPEITDNQFLAYSINQAGIESLLVGGGRAKLNAETLMQIVLLVPKKQEQTIIGEYLLHLDRLLTLHQRKLEKLKKIKKSCLEKMFA